MDNFKKSVLCLLLSSLPMMGHAELNITDGENSDGVVLFDKTPNESNVNTIETPVQSQQRMLSPNPPKSENTVELDLSGDGDSSDLSQEEINAIEAQGGSIVRSSSPAPVQQFKKGYGSAVMKNVPIGSPYPAFFSDLDKLIEIAKENPISATSGNGMPVLRYGSKGDNVALLSQALISKGYLKLEGAVPTPNVFDDDILASVKLAQSDLNLTVDGVAGPQLYSALGVSAAKITAEELTAWKNQIQTLIEIARTEGRSKVIIVNIPSYTLKAIDVNTGEVVVESKVIVGKSIHQTPITRMNMVGLKYNPNWTPPMSVIKRSVLPNLSSGNSYVRSHGLKAVDSNGNQYSLSNVSREEVLNGTYRIQQSPGTNNSLGVLKFETDNKDNIYLHDTNQRYLFGQNDRSLSLGCVRVQDWPRLAEFVSSMDIPTIQKNLDKGKTYIQRIDKTPIFMTYSLVDVVKGKADKFKDIYNQGGSLNNQYTNLQ